MLNIKEASVATLKCKVKHWIRRKCCLHWTHSCLLLFREPPRWRYFQIIPSKCDDINKFNRIFVLAHWTRCYRSHLLSHFICLMAVCVHKKSNQKKLYYSTWLVVRARATHLIQIDLRRICRSKIHLHFSVCFKFHVKSSNVPIELAFSIRIWRAHGKRFVPFVRLLRELRECWTI